MESVSCNLCGSQDAELVYQLADWSFDHQDSLYAYVQCKNCGLVYQNPRPTEAEILQFYPDDYECYIVKTDEKRKASWLLTEAIRYGMRRRIAHVTDHKKQGKLLDVGCATGIFLEWMRDLTSGQKEAHWNLQGVEVSPYASKIAQEKGFPVFTGRLMDARFDSECFDAITLWDVFEHLHNPKADLAEIHRILKKGGILVMRLPNIDSWDAKIFGKYWAGFEPPRHLYIFGKDTLTRMVEDNGFKILKLQTNASRYLTFVLSLQFYLVGKKVSPKMRNRIVRILNHPISRLIFAPVFFFYGMGLRGPLMTIVATKI